MRIKALTASVFVVMLCGCSGDSDGVPGVPNVRLYPVQGPIAAADPNVVLKGKTVFTSANGGTVMFVLPDNATCKGDWWVTKNKLDAKGEPVESIDPITGAAAVIA